MTSVLELTLAQVRARIHRDRLSPNPSHPRISKDREGTRVALVEPVLDALAWDLDNDREVQRDVRLDGAADSCAYGLCVSDARFAVLEVRALGAAVERSKWPTHFLRCASAAGFEWVVFTDGDEYRIYNAHVELSMEEMLLDSVRITDDRSGRAAEVLRLISRECIEQNEIGAQWRRSVVDRRVGKSLRQLLAPDKSLVRLILRRTKGLSSEDILGSLARARLDLSFTSQPRVQNLSDETVPCRQSRGAMSDAELRIATWLQQRSIDRWARELNVERDSYRRSQRRAVPTRRSPADRRSRSSDRRLARVAAQSERRSGCDRRAEERRAGAERRVLLDRRRIARRA